MVDRADALSRPAPRRPASPTALSPTDLPPFGSRLGPVLAGLAVAELVWLIVYLAFPLANAPKVEGITFRRGFILLQTFPQVIEGVTFRRSMLGHFLEQLSHVENLPQRVPIVMVAGLIGAAAIGIGDAILAILRLRTGIRWPVRIALSYGLGAAVLGGLTLIVGRMGWLHPWFIRTMLAGLAMLPFARMAWNRFRGVASEPAEDRPAPQPPDRTAWLFALGIAPFVTITMLGSMLPPYDFDVLEYHVEGPKEYFQAGQITFLPHNVYTNMPFDVEMLHLLGMSAMGDWWWGTLAGQLLVAMFGPAAAVMAYAIASRASTRAGWIASLVYLSTPWVHRFGIIAYVEGPLCFYQVALVWGWLQGWPGGADRVGRSWPLLGLAAGGAMGCKYTGLISAVIPFGLLAIGDVWRSRGLRPLLAYGLGWGIILAPWLVKNVADTGDPVYPLGYRVFHGRNWDEAMEAKWNRVHGPRPFSWAELGGSIVDIAGRSDWQSGLYAALAPLALLRPGSRRLALALWAFAAWIFLTWFLFTHRLDRFWLPLLPILAALAGLGADWVRRLGWTALLATLLATSLLTNLMYDSSIMTGFNEWTSDLATLRTDLPRRLNPPLALLDEKLPAGARPMLVGQSAVFHLNHRVVYNTVFNRETIEEIAKGKSIDEIRRALHDRGVTHIYVDWKEVVRFRQPGNYGFTDFVTRDLFAGWVAAGLLDRPVDFGTEQELYRVRM